MQLAPQRQGRADPARVAALLCAGHDPAPALGRDPNASQLELGCRNDPAHAELETPPASGSDAAGSPQHPRPQRRHFLPGPPALCRRFRAIPCEFLALLERGQPDAVELALDPETPPPRLRCLPQSPALDADPSAESLQRDPPFG